MGDAEDRKAQLSSALSDVGLFLRDDSRFCDAYIKFGPKGTYHGFTLDLQTVVNKMCQAKWLYEYTHFPAIVEHNHSLGLSWPKARDRARGDILRVHRGYPKVWPWLLPGSSSDMIPYTRRWALVYHARRMLEHWVWHHAENWPTLMKGEFSDPQVWVSALRQSLSRHNQLNFISCDVAAQTDNLRPTVDTLIEAAPMLLIRRIVNEHGTCIGFHVEGRR